MIYKDFKDRVLQLINRYSITGDPIVPSYNAQADYLVRMPGLLDSAQHYLATTTKRIYAAMPLDWDMAEVREGFYIIQLPSDYFQLCGRGISRMKSGEYTAYHRYRWMGRDRIVIPQKDAADMELHYYRYPFAVPPMPDDSYELDNTPDAQDAAAYYVAAMLLMEDNAFAYSALYNEFESRRQQMIELPQTEYDSIEDLYGNPGDGVYGV